MLLYPSCIRLFCSSILFFFSIVTLAEELPFEYRSLSDHFKEQVRANTFTDEPYLQSTSYIVPNAQHTQYIPISSSSPNFRPRTNAVDTSEGDQSQGGWDEMGLPIGDIPWFLFLSMVGLYCVLKQRIKV